MALEAYMLICGFCTHVAGGSSGVSSTSSGGGSSSPLAGKKVLVLGVGGAGRAIAFGAVQAGAEVRANAPMP